MSFCQGCGSPPLLYADPDPAFHHCNADTDLVPAFHFNSDPDPDPELHRSERICDHWSTDPPRLHSTSLTLLNFDFNADTDPAFHLDAGPDPDPASRNNADPDPQSCFFKHNLLVLRLERKTLL
jgi:hypothetical protein